MNKETLKMWRLIIPGIIIFFLILFGLTNSKEELFAFYKIFKTLEWNDSIYLVPVFIFGTMYYTLGIRWYVWQLFNTQIQENIKDKILNISKLKLLSSQWFNLKKDRVLMNIFYSFVDNDESLKQKSKVVMFNGLMWSSFIDLSILSCLGALSYSILSIFTSKSHYIILADLLFCFCFFSLICTSLLTRKHKTLSNEQLDIIAQTKKNEVELKIKEAINNLMIC
jgi:hypothetical protein